MKLKLNKVQLKLIRCFKELSFIVVLYILFIPDLQAGCTTTYVRGPCELYVPSSSNSCSIHFFGGCGTPFGGCQPKDEGGGVLPQEVCFPRHVPGGNSGLTPPPGTPSPIPGTPSPIPGTPPPGNPGTPPPGNPGTPPPGIPPPGGGGGGNVTCGVCGSWQGQSDASCSAGTFHNHPPDTSTDYKWTCRNDPHQAASNCGGKREVECDEEKPTGGGGGGNVTCGVCGSWQGQSDASCSAGTFHNHPPDTSTDYKWTCRNDPNQAASNCGGKRKAECDEEKPTTPIPPIPTTGQCTCLNSDLFKKCSPGCSPEGVQIPSPALQQYTLHNVKIVDRIVWWTCKGNGYHDSPRCEYLQRRCKGPTDGCDWGQHAPRISNICTATAPNSCRFSHCDVKNFVQCTCQVATCGTR